MIRQENTNFMQNIFGAQWPSTANEVTSKELANRIVNFLDPKTLCQAAKVNKSWAKLLREIQISTLSLPGQTAILSNQATSLRSDIEDTQAQEDTDFIYVPGTLKKIFSSNIRPAVVFTLQEESEIIQSKAYLDKNIKYYEDIKKAYLFMLAPPTTKEFTAITTVTMQKPSGELYVATLKDIKTMCLSKRGKLLEYILFLAEKANKLLEKRQYERAKAEFKIVLDYSVRVNGPNNIETLKIQAWYAIAQVSNPESDSFEKGIELLKNTVDALEKELKVDSPEEDIKKILAIAYYHLAQFFNIKEQNDIALRYLNLSENLRKQYHAPEHAMDRIRFLRGKLLFRKGKTPEALAILQACYIFRKSQDDLSPDLIPVLQLLHQITKNTRDRYESAQYLSHLLWIQRHIKADEREIISTQIKMIIALSYKTPDQEFWDLMEEIENKLGQILVNKQGLDIGRNYLEFAECKMSTFLPQEWSTVKKRKYYTETLQIILRAEGHIASARDKDFYNAHNDQVKNLKDRCMRSIGFFQDPAWTPFIGQALHPEDEAELALQSTSLNDTNSAAYTPEQLKELSDFSSEARHSLVDEAEQLLTVEDFSLLPEEGLIHPWRLRTAQAGISSTFTNTTSLEEMRQQLIADPGYANKIPPIQIGIYDGKVYSFDTRRLIVHQQAREENPEVKIRYQKIYSDDVQKRAKAIYSEKPWNGIVTAIRYGGKNSESIPYINPLFREQLEKKVVDFKQYPLERKEAGADENGFPIIKKKAEKIHTFLVAKAKSGSEYAKAILQECKQIAKTQGRQAAYQFLIQKKEEANSRGGDQLFEKK